MNKTILKILLLAIFLFTQLAFAFAGPGGKIAKVLFESPVGKILLVVLVIVFLPVIIYLNAKEFFAIRRTRKDLKMMSLKKPEHFDELSLKNRVTDIFTRVHKGWANENVEECSEFMSDWYWQNQQMVYLDKWKANNLENVCNLKRINSISPLHLRVANHSNYEGSRVVYKISANMEDYLRKRDSKTIVEGKKGFKDVETIWTFVLHNSNWKVDNIEQSDMALEYSKMTNIVLAEG